MQFNNPSSTKRKTNMKLQNLIHVLIGILCIGLLQPSQAVVPPPDGGYPGGNTAEGTKALLSQTTGGYNAAIGWLSLESLTTGSFNTGVGAGTLALNNGEQNTATGAGALLFHATGNGNTANGAFALFSDVSGQLNTATGSGALFTVNNGFNGSFNTADGAAALYSNMGGDNTAVGASALGNNTTGNDNTAVGVSALPNNDTGSNNIALGAFAGQSVTSASHTISIGVQGSNTDNSCFIGQIFNASSPGGSAVFIDANNRLGTVTSSKRFKEEIKPMDKASDALFALKPVCFRYKKEIDLAGISQLGLVAEDVAKVSPDLVVRDTEGKPYTVRYDQVNAMLLNEFLKEHRKVEEQESKIQQQEATISELKSTVAQQQKGLQNVTARLEQQASQIQKVSAQLEASKPAPQVALNNP
jgi:uncharacterized coiled-coil protein SlyX